MNIKRIAQGILAGYLLHDAIFGTSKGMNAPACTNRTKCTGLKKNGRLRKGFKFLPGGAIKKV